MIEKQNTEIQDEEKSVHIPILCHWLSPNSVYSCVHITCVKSDLVWISDSGNWLFLTNMKWDMLHSVRCKSNRAFPGCHTLNSKGDLIYIDDGIIEGSKNNYYNNKERNYPTI